MMSHNIYPISAPQRIVIVGHVDHGKSTLIGRLLFETDSLPDGKAKEIQQICESRGTDVVEWSFLLDAFQAERDQAVTIDTTQIPFSYHGQDFIIIDAPGHKEFLKNMISGAAQADTAILVMDAKEGVQEQTRRHAYLLSLLGIEHCIVAINKMDKIQYDKDRFYILSAEMSAFLKDLNINISHTIPMSARDGDMLSQRGNNLDWYKDALLLDALGEVSGVKVSNQKKLRFPVQDVYRQGEERILVGRVESGTLSVGDKILFSPTDERAVVTAIKVWPEDHNKKTAQKDEVVGITINQKLFIERGHIASDIDDAPILSNIFQGNIFWLGAKPLKVGNRYTAHYATHDASVTVRSIDAIIDTQTLKSSDHAAALYKNEMGKVTFRSRTVLPLDSYTDHPAIGRVVFYDNNDIVGGGIINIDECVDQRRDQPKSSNITAVRHLVSPDDRAGQKGHKSGVFWFTGLSGSGKSTLAMAVDKALFEKRYHSYVLDGDNVRYGLCNDLGFSSADRAENIRRVGEVAALQAASGLITLTAFISPYQEDRKKARAAAPDMFHEIYVAADLKTCETRDPKGLYRKARNGTIQDFTGIDSPYEAPKNPELIVDTQNNDLAFCVSQIVDYIEHYTALENMDNQACPKRLEL